MSKCEIRTEVDSMKEKEHKEKEEDKACTQERTESGEEDMKCLSRK